LFFCPFLSVIVLSVLLWYTDSDYLPLVSSDDFDFTKRNPWFSSFLVSSNPLSRNSW
jgi:hypothetical protein